MARIALPPILAWQEDNMPVTYINPYIYGGAANWWEAGGATGAVAVYQPIGAASLAASYVDLSGNGNDAAPGTAPTWDATNGWTFAGTEYLTTGVQPTSSYTMICEFTNTDTAISFRICMGAEVGTDGFRMWHRYGTNTKAFQNGTSVSSVGGGYPTQNIAIAGSKGYSDGSDVSVTLSGITGTLGQDIYLGAVNNDGSAANQMTGYIRACAIYNNTLTGPQVAAVAAAMAAL